MAGIDYLVMQDKVLVWILQLLFANWKESHSTVKSMYHFQSQFQQGVPRCQQNVISSLDHGRIPGLVSIVAHSAVCCTVLVHNNSFRTVTKVNLCISHSK